MTLNNIVNTRLTYLLCNVISKTQYYSGDTLQLLLFGHYVHRYEFSLSTVQFIRKYIDLTIRFNLSNILLTDRLDFAMPIITLRMNKLHFYDLAGLRSVLQNYYTFFYNIGFCSGGFLCITCDSLRRDGSAVTYMSLGANRYRSIFSTNIIDINLIVGDNIGRVLRFVDFIILLDVGLSTSTILHLVRLNTFIMGIVSDITLYRYIHNILPVEVQSIEVQYFFIELLNYSYLVGRRYAINQRVRTVVDILQNNLV